MSTVLVNASGLPFARRGDGAKPTASVIPHPRLVEPLELRKLRKRVERAVSRLIAVLDELDGDPEAEPWLGAPDVHEHVPQWPRAANDDREQEDEHGDEAEHGIADADGFAEQWGCRGAE